jgi:hypothetical protein
MAINDELMEKILDTIERQLEKDNQKAEAEVQDVWDAEARARGINQLPPVPDRLM